MAENEEAPAKADLIKGVDIGNLLSSSGPVVSCVILRTAQMKKPPTSSSHSEQKISDETLEDTIGTETNAINHDERGYQFTDLVEEVQLDTTPSKNNVAKVLGGDFTFIGQYEGEGIVLMARRGWVEEVETTEEKTNDKEGTTQRPWRKNFAAMSIKQLRLQCEEWGVGLDNMLEKPDLVAALQKKERELPLINPHPLQPPLQHLRIRGDILILKVAEVDEPLDEEGEQNDEENMQHQDEKSDEEALVKDDDAKIEENMDQEDNKVEDPQQIPLQMPTNEEFFLDYTKKQYLEFAVRTDIVPPQLDAMDSAAEAEEEVSDAEPEEEEKGDDEEYQIADDMEEMTEEEEKSAMLNIVMSELLRKFREENGRGPDTRELLEIRASVAEQLGMEVVTFDESLEEEEERGDDTKQEESDSPKRKAAPEDDGGEETPNSRKRVKFDMELVSEHHFHDSDYEDDGEEKKPAVNEESKHDHTEEDATRDGTTEENGANDNGGKKKDE